MIEAKFVSYGQFMDDLQEYEISSLLNMLKYANMVEWQQTRLVMYASLLPYFKKGSEKDIEKIWPMPFDDIKTDNISQDKIDQMKKIGEEYIKKIKKTN